MSEVSFPIFLKVFIWNERMKEIHIQSFVRGIDEGKETEETDRRKGEIG